MKIAFTAQGWADYLHWQEADPATARRLNLLIKEASRTPFAGIGKPEPLRGDLQGWWSRRLSHSDRLVYRVTGKGDEQRLEIAQCRFHY